jgi:Tetratricopeptide repeat
VLGEQHLDTLTSMGNLAVILLQTGDREGAIRLLRKCLAGRRKVLGENHPDTLATAEYLKKLGEEQVVGVPPPTPATNA